LITSIISGEGYHRLTNAHMRDRKQVLFPQYPKISVEPLHAKPNCA